MVRRLATIATLGGVLLAAPIASAFTMGEVATTTGMQGTLASSGSRGAAGTIGTVKKSLGASAGAKQAQLDGAAVSVGWGGKGGGSGWARSGGGWTTGAAGWVTASSSWAHGANGGGAWASGGWGGTVAAR